MPLLQPCTIGIETIVRCMRRSGRSRTTKTTSDRAPMESETLHLDFDGHRIAYRVTGRGPALVVLSLYRRRADMLQARLLSGRRQVFQIAPLGYGSSERVPGLHGRGAARSDHRRARSTRGRPVRGLGLLGGWSHGGVHRSSNAPSGRSGVRRLLASRLPDSRSHAADGSSPAFRPPEPKLVVVVQEPRLERRAAHDVVCSPPLLGQRGPTDGEPAAPHRVLNSRCRKSTSSSSPGSITRGATRRRHSRTQSFRPSRNGCRQESHDG